MSLLQAFVDARSIAETVGSAASDRDVGDGIPFNVYEGHHSHSARGDSDLDPVKQWPTKGKYLRFEELALESPESWNCTGGRVGKDHADGFEEAINWLSGFTGVPRGLEPDEQQRGQSSKPVSCGGGVGIYWNNNVSTLLGIASGHLSSPPPPPTKKEKRKKEGSSSI